MKTLIVGRGEIGLALEAVLFDYSPTILDIDDMAYGEEFDIMHVAFPYSDQFISEVKRYQKQYKPLHTIIHSTVPVGTSAQLGSISSPVTGIHPHLEKSLLTFTKFLGGGEASEVANYFRRVGMKVYLCDKAETLELAKLSQTTFYALMVEYVKDLKRHCDELDIPFSDAYTLFAQNYNTGYNKLGYPEFTMPLLVPIMKQQGGHCTIPNCDLWDTDFTRFIKELNARNET